MNRTKKSKTTRKSKIIIVYLQKNKTDGKDTQNI